MSRARVAAVSALVAAASVLLPAPAHAQRPPADVVLDLRSPAGVMAGDPVATLDQRGSASAEVSLAVLDGGGAVWREEAERGLVVDLPSATSAAAVPRAVLAVRDRDAPVGAGQPDAFTPGSRTFSFGADFRTSLVRMGRFDDGDNVLQRGLASDQAQYKLEIAGGRVACVLKGSAGEIRVHVGPPVDPRSWYSVRCTRLGEAAVLWAAEHRQDGSVAIRSRTRHGLIGDISWAEKRPPVSIGGKLAAHGEPIRSATDQLNGNVGRSVIVFNSSLAIRCAGTSCPYAVVA